MYIDVRARQIYDKLKKLIEDMQGKVHDYILLKDELTGETHKITMRNGYLCSRKYGEEPPVPESPSIPDFENPDYPDI